MSLQQRTGCCVCGALRFPSQFHWAIGKPFCKDAHKCNVRAGYAK